MDYKSIFIKSLNEELGQQGLNNQPAIEPQKPNDGDVWKQNNPGIADNPEINGKFDVAGLPVDMMENYSNKINQWRQDAEQMTVKLEEV